MTALDNIREAFASGVRHKDYIDNVPDDEELVGLCRKVVEEERQLAYANLDECEMCGEPTDTIMQGKKGMSVCEGCLESVEDKDDSTS